MENPGWDSDPRAVAKSLPSRGLGFGHLRAGTGGDAGIRVGWCWFRREMTESCCGAWPRCSSLGGTEGTGSGLTLQERVRNHAQTWAPGAAPRAGGKLPPPRRRPEQSRLRESRGQRGSEGPQSRSLRSGRIGDPESGLVCRGRCRWERSAPAPRNRCRSLWSAEPHPRGAHSQETLGCSLQTPPLSRGPALEDRVVKVSESGVRWSRGELRAPALSPASCSR